MIRKAATRRLFAARLRTSYKEMPRRGTYKYTDGFSSLGPRPRTAPVESPFSSGRRHLAADAGVEAWFALCAEKDYERAEALAEEVLETHPASRFARSTLAEIHALKARWEEALYQVREARRHHPENLWYRLTHADFLTEAKDFDSAVAVLEEAAGFDRLQRHAYKRLARLCFRLGDLSRALHWQQKLVGLAPNYLVYSSDYVLLAWLQVRVSGDSAAASRTLEAGLEIYRRGEVIRAAAERLERGELVSEPPPLSWPATDTPSAAARTLPQVLQTPGADTSLQRIPVPAPLVTMHTDLVALADAATASVREPSDVLAVSESVLAISQGRAIPLELVDPGPLARVLCRFVNAEGPLHSPQGMQGAVAEAGALRAFAAAAAGGMGKLLGVRGLFYKIAGAPTAMIDDVAACMPPFDHHLILGPSRPDEFAAAAAEALGCRVCVVDANNKTGAWIVGASSGIDKDRVEKALSDNPAGNEDQQTPLVLIKGL